MTLRVFLLAGEPSGDRLGAALMEGLQQLVPDVRFDGVGGPLMQAKGLTSRFPMEELSVMGIAEVLPKYRHLKRRIRETADAVIATQPDVMITIDSPDFSLRLAKLVKAELPDLHTIHYVAPSVWAWRPERAAKMARVIDQVLALLPFEPPFMEAEGMRCDFVGHPAATFSRPGAEEQSSMRAELGLGDEPTVAVMPGSRSGELARHGAHSATPWGGCAKRGTSRPSCPQPKGWPTRPRRWRSDGRAGRRCWIHADGRRRKPRPASARRSRRRTRRSPHPARRRWSSRRWACRTRPPIA